MKYALDITQTGSNLRITGETLSYTPLVTLDFSTFGWKSVALGGDVEFIGSNQDVDREVAVRILAGSAARTLVFPAGWVWLGAAAPVTIAANKTAVLSLRAFGPNDSDVLASYAVQI